MKLNINKACDLGSISVLPPHSRRSSLMDSSNSGRVQSSQQRSQSQQPFSQGMSLSQLSQSSLDDVLPYDQRPCSQERDNPPRRLSYLGPMASSRDESQMQLSRTTNHFMRRSGSVSTPDQRCHVSEELEHRVGSMESSLTRLGRTLDAVQNDVMQVNKTVKEVLLEVEGIRQKTVIQDNNVLLLVRISCLVD
ncbi:putative recombination initiation defects 3 [Wolffia australiana]